MGKDTVINLKKPEPFVNAPISDTFDGIARNRFFAVSNGSPEILYPDTQKLEHFLKSRNRRKKGERTL
jgi:hypothetical protein